MEIKRVMTLIIFALLLTAGFMFYFIIYLRHLPIQGFIINNGRDGHGCLANSGYKWDNSTQNCMKKSVDGSVIYQIVDFQSCFTAGYALSENNETHDLQCRALNGTFFSDHSGNALVRSLNGTGNTPKLPDNLTLAGNFTIKNTTNSS